MWSNGAKRLSDYLFWVNEEVADALGRKRQLMHPGGTPRFFDDPSAENIQGIKAELAFEAMTGLPLDENLYKQGDCGVDFRFRFRGQEYTVNVKGATTPVFFISERVRGREHRAIMLRMPKKDFGFEIINHYRHNSKLRHMDDLLAAINPSAPVPSV